MIELLTTLVAVVIGSVLIIWWLPYLVHELGHFVGARVAGARFDFVPLGPFVVVQTPGGRRIRRLIRRYACDATIPKTDAAFRQLFAAAATGPLLNVALGVAAVWLAVDDRVARAWHFAPLLLIAVGFFMAGHGLGHLLPWRPRGFTSDGRRMLAILGRTPSARRWIALRIITSLSESGIRPRDWHRELIEAVRSPGDGSTDDIAAALVVYWHLLDSARPQEARDCLESARIAATLPYLPDDLERVVDSELAYIEARLGADPSLGAESLTRARFVGPTSAGRVLAAVLLSYSYVDEARREAEVAREHLSELRAGFALMEEDLLNDLLEDCRRRSAGRPIDTQHTGAPGDGTKEQGAN
ncbi:MAG: hypothetical protein ACRDI2_19875 [Chloroflexota bacterium]